LQKGEFLYEGKAKKIFKTADPNQLLVEFKDDATAFDGVKKDRLQDKGILNNRSRRSFFSCWKKKASKPTILKL
jgi:phosphoribosylaminoimidazole-succinocarboxamide synthase